MECDTFTCLDPCLEKHLKGHRNSITALFYSPNEQKIASSSLDNSVLLWDLSGKSGRSYRFLGHDEAVMDVTFSPTGKYMASASRDKTVRLWVPTVTGSTGMFKAHSQTVRSVQFSPDGSKILTASDDKIIKLWSSDKYKFLASLVGHTNWVRRAIMSQDGSIIASCSDDKSTKLWNSETGECIHTYKDQKGHGIYLAWHPSSCYVAVGTTQGNIKLYDVRTHTLVQYYSIHSGSVNQLSFHPSGSYILTASKDGTMKILDLLEGHPLFTLSGHTGSVNAVNFSPSGNGFASAGEDKLGAKIWYQCYHSNKYPVTTFSHLDDFNDTLETVVSDLHGPNAHSTLVDSIPSQAEFLNSQDNTGRQDTGSQIRQSIDCSNNVGHSSHIPRLPPTRTTYTIPSIINKSTNLINENSIYGMIKLGDNDVCYTSGTIEWVGRKRSFPINSGFKVVNEQNVNNTEPLLKKVKRLNRTYTCGIDEFKECDCGDVLPTVNAIVDHLNALHEAVDLVDLRLNTIEGAIEKSG
ncbi:POC1 centriolar protein homolog A [Zerene cesonia]|uniref:POC1 centriolar protein homolog A n=1 Tax=Zerene cesonia TaxID=33412 RepID=UPI0018E58CB6|nr:POC1 centriolar protein homolog A [Zerene cesonia]